MKLISKGLFVCLLSWIKPGGHYFGTDSAPIPVNGDKKKSLWVNNAERAFGEEKRWLLLKIYWQSCSKWGYSTSQMLDLQARCLKYEYSHVQSFKQTEESLLTNNWEYKNLFKDAKHCSAFQKHFSFFFFFFSDSSLTQFRLFFPVWSKVWA